MYGPTLMGTYVFKLNIFDNEIKFLGLSCKWIENAKHEDSHFPCLRIGLEMQK